MINVHINVILLKDYRKQKKKRQKNDTVGMKRHSKHNNSMSVKEFVVFWKRTQLSLTYIFEYFTQTTEYILIGVQNLLLLEFVILESKAQIIFDNDFPVDIIWIIWKIKTKKNFKNWQAVMYMRYCFGGENERKR